MDSWSPEHAFKQEELLDLAASSAVPSGRERLRARIEAAAIGRVVKTAAKGGVTIGFLSHSHADKKLALGFDAKMRSHGVSLYLDWRDSKAPFANGVSTARRLRKQIELCDIFLLLATQHSKDSRWCPWELGYADRDKVRGDQRQHKVFVVPTVDKRNTVYGAEYLGLYPHFSAAALGALKAKTYNSPSARFNTPSNIEVDQIISEAKPRKTLVIPSE